jgi:Protein of unknown function (DUF1640)
LTAIFGGDSLGLMTRVISLPGSLRNKLGDEASEALINMFNEYGQGQKEDVIEAVEQRFEKTVVQVKAELKIEIEQVKAELKIEIEQVKAELKIEIEQVKAELKIEIEQVKAELKIDIARVETKLEQIKTDIIRWLFLFWIGQMGVVIGLIFALFTFFKN